MALASPKNTFVRIGIYRSSSIGDVVLATACLNLLRQLDISHHVTWIGKNPSLDLIHQAYPSIQPIDVSNHEKSSDLTDKLGDLDFMIDLQKSLKSKLLCQNFKRKYRKPYYTCNKRQFERSMTIIKSRMLGRTRSLPESIMKTSVHQFEGMVYPLKKGLEQHFMNEPLLSLNKVKARPQLPWPEKYKLEFQKKSLHEHWLCVAPGASWETKRVPHEILANVITEAQKLLSLKNKQEVELGLIFLGSKDDSPYAQKLVDSLGATTQVFNYTGQLSLWETAKVLIGQKCIICSDSALGHIAESVGTPSVVLFGPTAESFGFAPHLPLSKAFSSKLGCRPCSKHGKSTCRFLDKLCFTGLPVKQISEYIVHLLTLKSGNRATLVEPPLNAKGEF